MEKIETGIPGLFELRTRVHADDRGWFKEALNLTTMARLGIETPPLVQINHSRTRAHAFRGLHYQAPPFAQAKYVRCVSGHLRDIVVDIRRGSPTFGHWFETALSEDNHRALYVPFGFAHGFYAVTACELEYAVFGSGYRKEAEGGVRVDDPGHGFPWSKFLRRSAQWSGEVSMHERDASWPLLASFETPFTYVAESRGEWMP